MTFTDEELAVIRAAADRSGMAMAAWLGQRGIAAAKDHEMPASDVMREILSAVLDAGDVTRRVWGLLNQAVRNPNVADAAGPDLGLQLDHAVGRVIEVLRNLDDTARDVRNKL